ncbi:MAG: hypothetical protein P4L22_00905 [Candidatus Babeliales bacterium]|nr:hypothetical protein [Candidatus Babeliales bacterium]
MKFNRLILTFSLVFGGITYCADSSSSSSSSNANSANYEYLFAHGFDGDKNQVEHYKHYNIVDKNAQAFDGPEVYHPFPNDPGYRKVTIPNLNKTCLGQEADVQVLTDSLQHAGEQCNNNVVGAGVSKGASTWINAAAQAHNINKIKALVLESPFASANEMIYKVTYLEYIPGHEYIAKIIGKWFLPSYDFDGMQPIDSIKNIANKNLPIFIIHSKQDTLISINHSRRLYLEFLKCGFKHVYLIETETGQHSNLFTDQANGWSSTFESKVKCFYNDLKIKLLGYSDNDLSKNQPSFMEVNNRIIKDHDNKPAISRFIIKTLLSCYIVYKTFKYFPGVGKQLNNYMFKLMQLLKIQTGH